MTLIQFMERHRVIEFCGVACNGYPSERACECCESTEKSERYEFTVDSGQARLLCPDCSDAISRVLHPDCCDRYHSYHVRAWRLCYIDQVLDGQSDVAESIGALPPDYPEHGGRYHTQAAIETGRAGWGVYGLGYDDGLPMHVADCKTKQEAEAWANYLGLQDAQRILALLKPFEGDGRIYLQKTRPDATLEYGLNLDDPRKSGDLVVHPYGAALDYEPGPPWYVKTTLYRDKDWHEMVGQDIEDITSEDDLVKFLEEYTEPST